MGGQALGGHGFGGPLTRQGALRADLSRRVVAVRPFSLGPCGRRWMRVRAAAWARQDVRSSIGLGVGMARGAAVSQASRQAGDSGERADCRAAVRAKMRRRGKWSVEQGSIGVGAHD